MSAGTRSSGDGRWVADVSQRALHLLQAGFRLLPEGGRRPADRAGRVRHVPRMRAAGGRGRPRRSRHRAASFQRAHRNRTGARPFRRPRRVQARFAGPAGDLYRRCVSPPAADCTTRTGTSRRTRTRSRRAPAGAWCWSIAHQPARSPCPATSGRRSPAMSMRGGRLQATLRLVRTSRHAIPTPSFSRFNTHENIFAAAHDRRPRAAAAIAMPGDNRRADRRLPVQAGPHHRRLRRPAAPTTRPRASSPTSSAASGTSKSSP